MTRKRKSKSVNKSVQKRSEEAKRTENLSEKAEVDVIKPANDGFSLLNVPPHLLAKVFQKTSRKGRIASAQTCTDLHDFLVDTQLFYNTSNSYVYSINLECNKDEIKLKLSNSINYHSTLQYIIPIEECYRIRDYTFEVHPKTVTLQITHHSEAFVDAITPILARCSTLNLRKMPDAVVGTSFASMVKMLRSLYLRDSCLLDTYLQKHKTISSIWCHKMSLTGDEILDYFMNTRRTMSKIAISETFITGKKLIEFMRNSSFIAAPCLVSIDELRLTAADLNYIQNFWNVRTDRTTGVWTFKPYNVNIVVCIVQTTCHCS